MTNKDVDLNELVSDEFLDTLDNIAPEVSRPVYPDWVIDNESDTTYKVYYAIVQLKEEKTKGIKNYGKVASNKTAKSLFEIKKSDVSRLVGVSAQSIFRGSKFSDLARNFFDDINEDLFIYYEKEQKKQINRHKATGLRLHKKEQIVRSHQSMEQELKSIKAKTTKQVLDLVVEQLPLDLRLKLGL